MSLPSLDPQLFRLKLTTKTLHREARRRASAETAAWGQCRGCLRAGDDAAARVHAEDAIKSRVQAQDMHRLGCRLDAVANTVQAALTAGRACQSMASLLQALDAAARRFDEVPDRHDAEAAATVNAMQTLADRFDRAFPGHDLDSHTPGSAALAADEASAAPGTSDDDHVGRHRLGDEGMLAQRVESLLRLAAANDTQSWDSC